MIIVIVSEKKRREKTREKRAEKENERKRERDRGLPCVGSERLRLSQRRMLIGSFVVRTKLLHFLKHFPFSVKENPCSSRSQAKKSCITTQSPGPDRARVDRSTALFLTLCVVVFAVLSCWSVCLVKSVDERGLSLLKGFRYDSYLNTSWRDFVCLTQGSLRQ